MLDQRNIAELLGTTALFTGMRPAHLEVIARVTKLVLFEARTTVVRQGEGGSELYILAKGSVAVVREDPENGTEQVVGQLSAGDFFGEMSLLNGSRRAATIRTLEDTACVVLASASYESLLEKIPPVAVQISRYLAHRLDQQMGNLGFRFLRGDELQYDPELYGTFPDALLRKYEAIPLRLDGSTLTVAMTRPHDQAATQALRKELPGLGLQPVACASEDYQAFLTRHRPEPAAQPALSLPMAFHFDDGQPVAAPFSRLLVQAAAAGRLLVERSGQEFSFRVPGTVGVEGFSLDLQLEEWEREALGEQLDGLFGDQEGGAEVAGLSLQAGGKRCQLGVSRLPTLRGQRYSLSLSDPRRAIPAANYLWPTEALQGTVEKTLVGGGALLLVGPARSGRSSTLYTLMRLLEGDGQSANVIALEQEPLLALDSVAQVRLPAEFGSEDPGRDLRRHLRVAMAQAPDALVVDEAPEKELGQLLELADDRLTVLTTLRGGDPLGTLAGLAERHPAALNGLENVRLLMGQQLLRRICSSCKVEYSPSPSVLGQLEQAGLGSRSDRYFHGAGCPQCRGTGLRGRVASFELVQLNGFLAEMLRNRRPADAVRKAAVSNGLVFSFKSFARLLVQQGQILPTEALRLYGGASSGG